jgi:hypothetical protein
MSDTDTTMPVLHLPDDRDDAQTVLTAALHAAPGVWHEVWYPATTESDYDVVRYVESEDIVETHVPFAECGALYLAMIGARA